MQTNKPSLEAIIVDRRTPIVNRTSSPLTVSSNLPRTHHLHKVEGSKQNVQRLIPDIQERKQVTKPKLENKKAFLWKRN